MRWLVGRLLVWMLCSDPRFQAHWDRMQRDVIANIKRQVDAEAIDIIRAFLKSEYCPWDANYGVISVAPEVYQRATALLTRMDQQRYRWWR